MAVSAIPRQLAGRVGDTLGPAILTAIDKAVENRWDAARERAEALAGSDRDEQIDVLTKAFARELALAGGVAGGTAAVPTVGTAASLATAAAELGYFTLRAGELILTIGALHGHTNATVQERRAWILAVLLFGNKASKGYAKLAGTGRLPVTALWAVNSAAARQVVAKYGAKRGAIAVGRALPFGIGAAVGATANYAGVRQLTKHAERFFAKLPYTVSNGV